MVAKSFEELALSNKKSPNLVTLFIYQIVVDESIFQTLRTFLRVFDLVKETGFLTNQVTTYKQKQDLL